MPGILLLALVGVACLSFLSIGSTLRESSAPGGVLTITATDQHPGQVFWVGATVSDLRTAGAGTSYGRTPERPFATLDDAFDTGNCLAGRGDTVYVLPGHNEGSVAVMADIDVDDVTIVGLAHSGTRPLFDFDNAATTIDIGGDNVTIRNLRFEASAASVLIGLDIESSVVGVTIEDCEFMAAATGGDEFVEAIDLKSGNTGTTIRRNTFRTEAAAGACTHAITISAACNDVTIEDNVIFGNYSTAAIGDAAAGTGYIIARNRMWVKDGEPGIELHSGSTGLISDNFINSTGLAIDAMIVAAGCAWSRNMGCNTDGTEARPIGVAAEEEISGGVGAAGTGKDWFVDSVDGTNGGTGTSWENAVDDIEEAIDFCTTDLGDTIHVADMHRETVGSAAAIDLDKNGIRIIGRGEGDARPVISFDTTSDKVAVGGTGCLIRNIVFSSAIEDLVVALDVETAGDGLTVDNCEFLPSTTSKEMLVAIGVATTVLNLTVKNCTFRSIAGEDCTNAILAAGTTSNFTVKDCVFMGDWDGGVIEHSAGKATDCLIVGNIINNIDASGGLCIEMESTSTGIIDGNSGHGGKTSVDPIVAVACQRTNNNFTQTEGIETSGKYGNVCVRATAVTGQTTQLSLFTIATGRVIIYGIIGEVTTNLEAGANTMKLTINPTAGSSADIAANLDTDADQIGTMYGVLGDPALPVAEYGCMIANPLVVDAGVIETDNSASKTGAIQWTCFWEPFDAGATLVAA